MKAEHVRTRCYVGAYDRGNEAGVKTTAVSEQLLQYPQAVQAEIDNTIRHHTAIDDGVPVGGSIENRGILRIVRYKDLLLAIRTRRVYDRCTQRGPTSFTHTYLFKDAERKAILRQPEALTRLESYDTYEGLDSRCGGLSGRDSLLEKLARSGMSQEKFCAGTYLNPALVMPAQGRDDAAPGEVFVKCGFKEDTFRMLFYSLSNHLYDNGAVALLLPGVTKDEWSTYGGSLKGEQLMAAVIRLLPLSMARSFTGISYWNEAVTDDSLTDIKLRIYSGKYTNGLERMTLIDLQNGRLLVDEGYKNCVFAEYLWEIRNNPDDLKAFHGFVEEILGANIDRITKNARVMDMVTRLWKYQQGQTADLSETLKSVITVLGPNVSMFPEVEKLTEKLCNQIQELSSSLEITVLKMMNKRNADSMKLYARITELLFNKVLANTGQPETVRYLTRLLTTSAPNPTRDRIMERIRELTQQTEKKELPSGLRKLLLSLYTNEDTGDTMREKAYALLSGELDLQLERKKDYSVCLDICEALLCKRTTITRRQTLYPKCCQISDELKDPALRARLAGILESYQMLLYRKDETGELDKLYDKMFAGKPFDRLKDYFTLFIRFVPWFAHYSSEIVRDETNNLKNWRNVYKAFLEVYKDADARYLNADQELKDFSGELRADGLFQVELVQMEIETCCPRPTVCAEILELLWKKNQNKAFDMLMELCNVKERSAGPREGWHQSLLDWLCSEPGYAYPFYLYLLGKEDAKRSKYFVKLEERLMQGDFLDQLLAYADSVTEKQLLATQYYRLWKDYDRPGIFESPSEERTRLIRKEEERLEKRLNKQKDRVMKDFAAVYAPDPEQKESQVLLTEPSLIADANKVCLSEIDLLLDGYKNYGWGDYFRRYGGRVQVTEDQLRFRKKLDEESYTLDDAKKWLGFALDKNAREYALYMQPFENYFSRFARNEPGFEKRDDETYIEHRAWIALLLVVMNPANQGGYCGKFLDIVNKKEDHARPAYVLYALKLLSERQRYQYNSRINKIIDSFVNQLAKELYTPNETLRNHAYLYTDHIRPYLEFGMQKQLYEKAKKDAELAKAFEVVVSNFVQSSSKKGNRNQNKGYSDDQANLTRASRAPVLLSQSVVITGVVALIVIVAVGLASCISSDVGFVASIVVLVLGILFHAGISWKNRKQNGGDHDA